VTSRALTTFDHKAVLFTTPEEFLAAAVPFVQDGLSRGEVPVVACSEPATAWLANALGADRVGMLPMSGIYRRPAGTIRRLQDLVESETAAGARGVRVVAGIDFGDEPVVWAEWMRYEAVLNKALATYPLRSLCAYNTDRLPAEIVVAARLTHPGLVTATSTRVNPDYLDPAEFLRESAQAGSHPLAEGRPALHESDVTDLSMLRWDVRLAVVASTLSGEVIEEFIVAVNEVVTNALVHGEHPVEVKLWTGPSETLCEVVDGGSGFDDPFAGYEAARRAAGGMGLWLARQMCDHLALAATPSGFTVRLSIGE
jgi:anti-sigma regulatory factor (Ser/Thr protein kinase)